MEEHNHSLSGGGQSAHARSAPVEARDEAARPLGSGRVPGAEFPVAVYLSVVAAFILLASWLAFGAGAEADLGLGIATVLGTVFFALPIVMFRTATHRFSVRRRQLNDFLYSPVDTATGKLTGSQAWLQILVIPLALVFAAILIGAVHVFVA